MELQELKNVWDQYDKRTGDLIKIDYEFLKKISLEKAQSMLMPLKFGAIIEVLANFIFLVPVIRFAMNNILQFKFSLPAILLAIVIAATIAWNIYSLILLGKINYKSPVVAIQKKLQTFKVRNIYLQQNLLYILYPFVQTLCLIIFCKAIINMDIYQYTSFLFIQFGVAVATVPLIIWIIKLSQDKSIDDAVHFLKDLRKFEHEDQVYN